MSEIEVYQSEVLLSKSEIDLLGLPKEKYEEEAIRRFLKEIPLDKLKKLVNFEEINPYDKKQWENYSLQKELSDLSLQRKIKIKMKLKL